MSAGQAGQVWPRGLCALQATIAMRLLGVALSGATLCRVSQASLPRTGVSVLVHTRRSVTNKPTAKTYLPVSPIGSAP